MRETRPRTASGISRAKRRATNGFRDGVGTLQPYHIHNTYVNAYVLPLDIEEQVREKQKCTLKYIDYAGEVFLIQTITVHPVSYKPIPLIWQILRWSHPISDHMTNKRQL